MESALRTEGSDADKRSEIQFFIDQINLIRSSITTAPALPAPWLNSEHFINSIKNIKSRCNSCNDICTKVGVIGVKGLTGDTKSSIYDELMGYIRDLFSLFMSIVQSCEFCIPLLDDICISLRSEFQQLIEVLKTVEDKSNSALNSCIGMVWKSNEYIQKLPESNKIAFRRVVMKNISIVEDTNREFSEYLQASTNKLTGSSTADMNDEINDDEEDDMCSYTLEEIPIVESALRLIADSKIVLKVALVSITEVSNYISTLNDEETKKKCFVWVYEATNMSTIVQDSIVEMGSELYHPVDISDVEEHRNSVIALIQSIKDKIFNPGFFIEKNSITEKYYNEIEKLSAMHT